MREKGRKRGICIVGMLLMLLMICSVTVAASGKYPATSKKKSVATYAMKNASVPVYSDSACTQKVASIKKGTEIKIYSLDGCSAKCTYKLKKKRKVGYIRFYDVCADNFSANAKATKKIITFRRQDLKKKYGTIKKGSDVWIVGKVNDRIQVIYKNKSSYQMGWISMASYSSLNADTSEAASYYTRGDRISQGWYQIATMNNTDYVLDAAGWGTSEGTNIEICQKNLFGYNQHPNQRVYIQLRNMYNNTYTIRFGHTNMYLTYNRGSDNAELQSWKWGSDSQLFYFKRQSNGSYQIISASNGRVMDNAYQRVGNGNNVLFWYSNNNQCQTWQLIPSSELRVSGNLNGYTSQSQLAVSKSYLSRVRSYKLDFSGNVECNYPMYGFEIGIYADSTGTQTINQAGTRMNSSAMIISRGGRGSGLGSRSFHVLGNLSLKSLRAGTYYALVKVKTMANSNREIIVYRRVIKITN